MFRLIRFRITVSGKTSRAESEPMSEPYTKNPVNLLVGVNITHLANQLNAEFDLPWVPEGVEQVWIEWVLTKIVSIIPLGIVEMLVSAADGLNPAEAKAAEDRITALANKLIDIPALPENLEEALIRPVVRQLLTFATRGRALSVAL